MGAKDTDKLKHVLLWSIRELLIKHGAKESTVRTASRERLIQLVARTEGIEESEIDRLYEEYRYGARPTFRIYLLPPGDISWNSEAFRKALSAHSASGPQASLAEQTLRYEDSDVFDSVQEIAVSYLHEYRFINAEDNPDAIQERRYAYLWIDTQHRAVVIIARDTAVGRPLLTALSQTIQLSPVPPQLSQPTLDRIARREATARLRLLDKDGIGRSFSGLLRANPEAKAAAQLEVERRLKSGDERRSGLFSEEIAGRPGSLGVSAPNATLFLTLDLSLSQLRQWAVERLIPIIDAVRADTETTTTPPANAFNLKGLAVGQRVIAKAILNAVFTARTLGRSRAQLSAPIVEVIKAFPGRFTLGYVGYCAACQVDEPLVCAACSIERMKIDDSDGIVCASCGAPPELQCEAGHHIQVSEPATTLSAVPDDAFRRELIQRLQGNGGLDPERGYILLRDQTVWAGNASDPNATLIWQGDQITVGNITGSGGIAIGRGAHVLRAPDAA